MLWVVTFKQQSLHILAQTFLAYILCLLFLEPQVCTLFVAWLAWLACIARIALSCIDHVVAIKSDTKALGWVKSQKLATYSTTSSGAS